jgi:hypothetical protein
MATPVSVTDKLNLSLDDIIKKSKTANKPKAAKPAKPPAKPKLAAHPSSNKRAAGGMPMSRPVLGNRAAAAAASPLAPSRPPLKTGTPVLVSNLNPNIDHTDLQEIFIQCGLIKKIVMPQKSAATVIFKTRQSALRAVNEFHRRELDGKPMFVVLKEAPAAAAAAAGSPHVRNPKRAALPAGEAAKPAGESGRKRQRHA